ncbi:MAG: hypothetical protein QXW58_00080 [Thermosphaera sp.]
MSKLRFVITMLTILILYASVASSLTLDEIRDIASSPEGGDVLLKWVPGGFWSAPYVDENGVTRQECTWPGLMVTRDDGTTLWIESNFWNIADGVGENYFRFINSTDKFAFYVKLENVITQWGGVGWATPGAVIVGRAPPQFAALPAVGGYSWFSLPMSVNEFIRDYEELYLKVSYELVRAENTMVRYGLLLWFENPAGGPLAEVYIAFHDDFGGWAGDRTVVKTITVPLIVDGQLLMGQFEVQRALSGGGWAAMVFLLKNADLVNNSVVLDVKPFVEVVFEQMTTYFQVPADNLVWSNIVAASYSGSNGTSFEFGWILHDARLIPPELSPKIIAVTVTETVTTTRTVTNLIYETETVTETETKTQSVVTTTTATTTVATTEYQTDYTMTGVAGIALLVVGFIVGWFMTRKKA